MVTLQGRSLVGGRGIGPALVTQMPINFSAAFGRAANAIPGQRSVIQDRHHELFKKNIRGKVLIFPACIGSTFTGMVLMQIMYKKEAPVAMIVQEADSLLVSGSILADVWFKCGIPVIEYKSVDIFDKIRNGDIIEAIGDTGEIKIYRETTQ